MDKIKEKIEVYKKQMEQAKEIYIKALGSIEALESLLKDKKDSK